MTLFTLRNNRNEVRTMFFIYLGISIFCVVFGFVYEMFSHGVLSTNMYLTFLYPLVLGTLAYALLYFVKKEGLPSEFSSDLYNAGVATLTIGTYFQGVLDIYGTTRDVYFVIFLVVGISLTVVGLVSYIVQILINNHVGG